MAQIISDLARSGMMNVLLSNAKENYTISICIFRTNFEVVSHHQTRCGRNSHWGRMISIKAAALREVLSLALVTLSIGVVAAVLLYLVLECADVTISTELASGGLSL